MDAFNKRTMFRADHESLEIYEERVLGVTEKRVTVAHHSIPGRIVAYGKNTKDHSWHMTHRAALKFMENNIEEQLKQSQERTERLRNRLGTVRQQLRKHATGDK